MAVPDISNAFNIALRIQEENLIFFFLYSDKKSNDALIDDWRCWT